VCLPLPLSFLPPSLNLLAAPPHQRSAHARVRATPGRGQAPTAPMARTPSQAAAPRLRPTLSLFTLTCRRASAPVSHTRASTSATTPWQANRDPSVTLLPLPRLARASNPPGEAPAARHRTLGDFPLWFLCSPPGGEKGEERRRGKGEEESTCASPPRRLAGVEGPEAGAVRDRKRAIHERERTGAEDHDASPPHVASIIDNFPAAAATATSSPPPQREPLRVLLLPLLTTQGGVPQCHAAPAAAPCSARHSSHVRPSRR
jgi:hypothetical protein